MMTRTSLKQGSTFLMIFTALIINIITTTEISECDFFHFIITAEFSDQSSDKIWFKKQFDALENLMKYDMEQIQIKRLTIFYYIERMHYQPYNVNSNIDIDIPYLREAYDRNTKDVVYEDVLVEPELKAANPKYGQRVFIYFKKAATDINKITEITSQTSKDVLTIVLGEGEVYLRENSIFIKQNITTLPQITEFLVKLIRKRCLKFCPTPKIPNMLEGSCEQVEKTHQCRVVCKEKYRYKNVSSDEITCSEYFTWGELSSCEPVCVHSPVLQNGRVTAIDNCERTFLGKACPIECNEHYRLRWMPFCEDSCGDVKWNSGPYCELVTCEKGPLIDNAEFWVKDLCNPSNIGDTCDAVRCNFGFESSGVAPVCEIDKETKRAFWQGDFACVPAKCRQNPVLESGYVAVSCVGKALEEKCDSLMCYPGYIPKSATYPTCVYDSKTQKATWSGPFECQKDTCSEDKLNSINFLKKKCRETKNLKYCDLTCKRGFSLVLKRKTDSHLFGLPHNRIYCFKYNDWSATPFCRKTECHKKKKTLRLIE